MHTTLESLHATFPAAGMIDRSRRVRLELGGPDRAKFLHNLTTQDVKRLPGGEGREAFVTSPQGKTLAYVTLIAVDDRIILRTDREGFGPLLPHLYKYGVFDDVTIDDVSEATFELHLAGRHAEGIVEATTGVVPPAGDLRHAPAMLGGVTVRIVRESPTGLPGLTVIGPAGGLVAVRSALEHTGNSKRLVTISYDLFDVLRVATGTPLAGIDVTPESLPQEVARDAQAINFVKGCYLGQETVARIDALGHVNKLLRVLWVDGSDPIPPGATVEADAKKIGTITSAVPLPGGVGVVALGYVRTPYDAPGTWVKVVAAGHERDAEVGAIS